MLGPFVVYWFYRRFETATIARQEAKEEGVRVGISRAAGRESERSHYRHRELGSIE